MRRTFWATLIGCFVIAGIYAGVFYRVGYYGIPHYRWGDFGLTLAGSVLVIGLIASAVMFDNRIVRGVTVVLAFVVGTWGFQMVIDHGGSLLGPIATLIILLSAPTVAYVVKSVAQKEHNQLVASEAATTPKEA